MYYNNNTNTMKNLIKFTIFGVLILGTASMFGQSSRFGLVELNDKYQKEMYDLNDNNSCSVRLIASYFDISYYEAYDKLKAEGREHGKGASITKIVKTFNKVANHSFVNEFYDVSEKRGITLNYFLNNYAKENTDYILIHKGHITWLKVGDKSKKGLLNTLYGNEKDRAKNIIVYLPIKKR